MSAVILQEYAEEAGNDEAIEALERITSGLKLNEMETALIKSAGVMLTTRDVIAAFTRILTEQVYPALARKPGGGLGDGADDDGDFQSFCGSLKSIDPNKELVP